MVLRLNAKLYKSLSVTLDDWLYAIFNLPILIYNTIVFRDTKLAYGYTQFSYEISQLFDCMVRIL